MENHFDALTHIAIILAGAFIGGALFRKLRQPVLVGYIIVGVIFGPSMLGIVGQREEVSLLAELGILLLLFIVGMEINLKNFRPIARVSLVMCGSQIAAGLLAMAILGLFFDWPVNRAILLGFAIALSSTAVALKILEDMNLRRTRIGESCVGILIAQDLAVIPMLLIIGALNTAQGFNYEGLVRLFIAAALMAALVYLLSQKPKAFQDIWKKFETLKFRTMQEQTALTGLAICFTAAALSGMAGLSAAYGAFLAGIVIGHTKGREQLETHTKPIFDVTIMVFFLSIGLLIDLEFMAANWLAILLILFVTMALKTVLNFFVLRRLGMPKSEAYVTGAVLAQIGEFSFILAAAGLAAGAIMTESHKFVVSVISLSLLATPIWLYLVKRFQILKEITDLKKKARRAGKSARTPKGRQRKKAVLNSRVGG